MTLNQYTGFDKISNGKRPGLENFVRLINAHFGLWNNGTFAVRNKRGKTDTSIHATGRAVDLSWRGTPYRGSGKYEDAAKLMDFLVDNADALHIEAIFDYYPAPFGRGWKCDRGSWTNYTKRAFSGSPGGDWIHVEISNEKADDPQYYEQKMAELLGAPAVEIKNPPAQKTETAPSGTTPWLQVGAQGDEVKRIQKIVDANPIDGRFGPKTENAIKTWQAKHDLHVDGIWGPASEKKAKELASSTNTTPQETKTPPAPTKPAPAPAAPKMKYPGRPIKKGARGELVKAIQQVLRTKTDGVFGPVTEGRLREWQASKNLKPDGICGPRTWAKMFS